MSKHTPEPWALFEVGDGRPHLCPASDSDKMSILTIAEEDGVTFACVYKDSDANRIVTCVNACAGMEDPASEIAELKRQRDELLWALHDAATSLETIQLRSFGADSYLDDKHSMRAYAGARAAVAREAITKAKGSSS